MPTVRKKNIETKIRYSQLKSYLSNGYVLIDDQSESGEIIKIEKILESLYPKIYENIKKQCMYEFNKRCHDQEKLLKDLENENERLKNIIKRTKIY
ncbi:hypothetical protein [Thomasclavelia cocleata]|uniref:hypothetical protein n=1 Tax=Thomasclavelia cocleata TaxID=69824 RepID=UPI00272E7D47|nr:hypothetical protein [Thomasclavelia cocleata]